MSASIDYTVPSIAETQLTGWIGTGSRTVRDKVYSVRLEGGKAPICTVDGKPVDVMHNPSSAALVRSVRKFFGV